MVSVFVVLEVDEVDVEVEDEDEDELEEVVRCNCLFFGVCVS